MYMSYCRQEGARAELRACLEDAREHYYNEAEYRISDREIECFRGMVREFCEFLADFELLDECGDLREKKLDLICDAMARDGESDAADDDENYSEGRIIR